MKTIVYYSSGATRYRLIVHDTGAPLITEALDVDGAGAPSWRPRPAGPVPSDLVLRRALVAWARETVADRLVSGVRRFYPPGIEHLDNAIVIRLGEM